MTNFLRIGKSSQQAKVLFSLLLALAVLALSLPQPAQAQAHVTCRTFHTIREGDRTPTIAHTYGLTWKEIALANDLDIPTKLVVGERLCIPRAGEVSVDDRDNQDEDEDEEESTTIGSNTTLSAVISGNRVIVTAAKFKSDSAFKVKVRDAGVGVEGWYVLGSLKVDRNDTETAAFTLPEALRDVTRLSVCLKNQTTDELLCRMVVNP